MKTFLQSIVIVLVAIVTLTQPVFSDENRKKGVEVITEAIGVVNLLDSFIMVNTLNEGEPYVIQTQWPTEKGDKWVVILFKLEVTGKESNKRDKGEGVHGKLIPKPIAILMPTKIPPKFDNTLILRNGKLYFNNPLSGETLLIPGQ